MVVPETVVADGFAVVCCSGPPRSIHHTATRNKKGSIDGEISRENEYKDEHVENLTPVRRKTVFQ